MGAELTKNNFSLIFAVNLNFWDGMIKNTTQEN